MSINKKLKALAVKNTSVTQGTKIEQVVLKEGVPNDHAVKHLSSPPTTVGVSVGSTLNMDNFESLRVDTWLTDSVKEGETIKEAYDRISKIAKDTLFGIILEYK